MNGTVLFFDRLKGFGFIEPEDGSEDLFFHVSQIVIPGPAGAKRLAKGQPVTYEVGINPNRGNEVAVNVTPIPAAPVTPTNGGNSDERQ